MRSSFLVGVGFLGRRSGLLGLLIETGCHSKPRRKQQQQRQMAGAKSGQTMTVQSLWTCERARTAALIRRIFYDITKRDTKKATLKGSARYVKHMKFLEECCISSTTTRVVWRCVLTPGLHSALPFVTVKNSSSSGSSLEVIPDICTVFTRNPETLRSLLINKRVVNWRSGLIFRGIPASHCHVIKELASLSGLDITEYWGYNTFIHHSPDNLGWQEKLLNLPISVLDESHAELVDRHLAYGGSQESINHVRACIRHLPNHCVMDEKGRPVSWMLSDELCELRMANTLPEYRRTGHPLALSLALMRRMSSVGLPVYCHINHQNQATINAVTSLGFSVCPGMEKISVLLICKDKSLSRPNDNKVCWMTETTPEK
ncbi:glycine N-acyltransferase-like protein 2 isoform X1 [Scomber scombrus]|uniref:Glycine N-acyltransferase-like protein n=1 Tax=Scomber scombrus TaxID=13677 RepID=A0AAV1MWZ6_SCOSC